MDKELTVIYNNPDPQAGGIPRYAHRILEGLKEEGVEFQEIDFSELDRESIVDKVLNLVYRRRQFISNSRDELGKVNHFLQPELYFPTDGTDIVTVHDLFMKTYWEPNSLYEKVQKRIYSNRVDRCIEHADVLIAVSEQTKETLIEEGAESEDIHVVNLGVREKFKYTNSYEQRDNLLGYLGDFRPRKRVDKLLRDFEDSDLEYSVSIAGSGGVEEAEIRERYSGKGGIIFEGRVPEENLVSWYNSLKAFLFPTELEGFGLPVLEAVACGTPVFVYEDARISPEIKDLCIEITDLSKIPRMIGDVEGSELKEKSERVKKEFDWRKTVKRTVQIYSEVA
jgi:glycosyltransferase involved in cell wall biosynthesis